MKHGLLDRARAILTGQMDWYVPPRSKIDNPALITQQPFALQSIPDRKGSLVLGTLVIMPREKHASWSIGDTDVDVQIATVALSSR